LKYIEIFANFWIDFLDILFNICSVKTKNKNYGKVCCLHCAVNSLRGFLPPDEEV